MAEKRLPPLLGSDKRTLKDNIFDRFYEKKPSDLWRGFVENVRLRKPKKCNHYFEKKENSVFCRKCHMGLQGKMLKVKKGHVFFGDQRLF